MAHTPSAPASSTARPTATMSVTFGVSLTSNGNRVTARTPAVTSASIRGSTPKRSPRPRSTLRSTWSAMEGVRHAVPIDPIGAHAWPLRAAEQVSAPGSWDGAAEAGAEAAAHRGLQRDLDGFQWQPELVDIFDQGLQHRGGTAGQDVDSLHPDPPPQGRGEQVNDRAVIAGAAIVGSGKDIGAGETIGGQELRRCPGAKQHRDPSFARDQRLDDSGEDRDAQPSGHTDDGTLPLEAEAATEGAQQVQLVALMTNRQPAAASPNDIEDEPDPTTLRIGPGGAVGAAQDRLWRSNAQLEKLAGLHRGCRRRVMDDELDGIAHRCRALYHYGRRKSKAHARTSAVTADPTYSPSEATWERCSRRQARNAWTNARAVSRDVRHGMRRSTDARRISYPSRRGTPGPLSLSGPADDTVLTTS